MEYLEYLRNLSSPDIQVSISSIFKISAFIAAQPSPINVNTIALHLAVVFKDASNRLRYFIAKFFQDRQSEMSMLKSRREFFLNITSVTHSNDPVGQSYMLKIMGSLSSLLSDLLEFQHMVLLSLDSPHPRVRQTAINTIPILLPYAPKLGMHIFNKDMPPSLFLKFLKGLSNSEDVVKAAYTQAVKKFKGKDLWRVLVKMTARAPLMTRHVKEILSDAVGTEAEQLCIRLVRMHGSEGLFEKQELDKMLAEEKFELLNELYKNDEYKQYLESISYIPQIWERFDRNNHPSSLTILHSIMAQIDSGDLTSLDSVSSLNNYQKYQLATRLIQNTHFQHAKSILDSLLEPHITNEIVYEWLQSLSRICELEMNPGNLSNLSSYSILSSLECLGAKHDSYFQTTLILNRIKLIESNVYTVLTCLCDLSMLYSLRESYHNLLYLFPKPQKSTVSYLKYWRDLCGVMSVVISYQDCRLESILEKVQLFYPNMRSRIGSIIKEEEDKVHQLLAGVLQIPSMYPPQFFRFDEILSLHLEVPYENPIKLTRTKEFVLEIGIKLPSLSHKPKTIRFELKSLSNQTRRVLTHITHEKLTNASGAAALSLELSFPESGQYTLSMSACILNASGIPVGKTEYAELTVSCLMS